MNLAVVSGRTLVPTDNFTKDQKKAYDELIEFINSEYNPNDYKRALIGPAGTGKTYLIKALIKNCTLSYSQTYLSFLLYITRVPGGKSPENTVFFLREHRPRTDLDLLSQ